MNTHFIPGIANGTISKGQLVKYAAAGWVACSSQGELADGVAWNDAVAGGALTIQVGGIITYKVGGTGVADGVNLTPTAGGLGELAATGDVVRMRAYGAGAAGAFAQAIWVDRITL